MLWLNQSYEIYHWCFFQRNKSYRICEIPYGREILLRNVKYALRRVRIYFISQKALAFYFTISARNYFTSTELIFHI